MMPHKELVTLGFYKQVKTTPHYEQVGDFLLIGTDHNQVADKERRRFRTELEAADHVFVEGYLWGNALERFQRIGLRNTFDVAAFEYGADKIRYLEEGLRLASLAEQYGINKRSVGVYESLYGFISSNTNVSSRSVSDFTKKYLRRMIDSPAYEGIDHDLTVHCVQTIYPRIPHGSREVIACYKAFMARARDINFICPSAINGNKLAGNKVAVVGASHIQLLRAALEGRQLNDLSKWQEITDAFFEPFRSAAKTLDSLIEEQTG